jgi:hypothetical protein
MTFVYCTIFVLALFFISHTCAHVLHLIRFFCNTCSIFYITCALFTLRRWLLRSLYARFLSHRNFGDFCYIFYITCAPFIVTSVYHSRSSLMTSTAQIIARTFQLIGISVILTPFFYITCAPFIITVSLFADGCYCSPRARSIS